MTSLEEIGYPSRAVNAYNWMMILVVIVAHLFGGASGGSTKYWDVFTDRVLVVFVHVSFMTLARMAMRESETLVHQYATTKLAQLDEATTPRTYSF